VSVTRARADDDRSERIASRSPIIRTTVLAAAVPVLARLDLRRLHALVEPRRTRATVNADALVLAQHRARGVDRVIRAGSPLIRPGCLTRGITLYHLLRCDGVDVTLCFGVGTVDGRASAHCWLALAGEAILERRDPRAVFREVAQMSRAGVVAAPGSVDP
jgi:hypothetical protein